MVEDIWASVDDHAKFNSEFRNHINSLEQLNFYNFKEIVDDEIRRVPYVPPRLKFEDKYGIIQGSKVSSRSRISGYNHSNRNWTWFHLLLFLSRAVNESLILSTIYHQEDWNLLYSFIR